MLEAITAFMAETTRRAQGNQVEVIPFMCREARGFGLFLHPAVRT
jgi:hypothetical protein